MQMEIKHTFILDNSDIISDPSITSYCAWDLWAVIHRYNIFTNNNRTYANVSWPKFKFIMTARKFTFSHISAYCHTLEQSHNLANGSCVVCDISELYSSGAIISHRLVIGKNHDMLEAQYANELKTINRILNLLDDSTLDFSYIDTPTISSESKTFEQNETFNLDAFSNHNYRTFSNLLSIFIQTAHFKHILDKCPEGSQPFMKASLIYIITKVYLYCNGHNVWEKLGYSTKFSRQRDYPTTLSRLLLNYLFYVRRFPSNDVPYMSGVRTVNGAVSLNTLVSSLSKVRFMSISSIDNNLTGYNHITEENTRALIISRLAEMCARNLDDTNPYGYDENEKELWRRPLFYKGESIPGTTASTVTDLKSFFSDSLLNTTCPPVQLSITDEGCVLISSFVIDFEFYSARLGDSVASSMKPLCLAESADEIDTIINVVYNSLVECCEYNAEFAKQYKEAYRITDDEYIKQPFHPRTGYNWLKLKNSKIGRPQLHLVRVIYSHVSYFDYFKTYLFHRKSALSDEKDINENRKKRVKLTQWIGKYLKLYKDNFEKIITNTSNSADNVIYSQLNEKYEKLINIFKTGLDEDIHIQLD